MENQGLNRLKGYSSFSVALYHLWTLQVLPLAIFRFGWLGVPVFFALSQYLLMLSLQKNQDLKTYLKRRVLRILPLYYIVVFTVYFVDLHVFHLDVTPLDLVEHILFVSSFLQQFQFQYLFWSIQIEFFMYFTIPLVMMASDKVKIAIGFTMYAITFVFSLIAVNEPYPIFHVMLFELPFWLGAYGAGIFAYLIEKYGVEDEIPLLRGAMLWIFVVLLIAYYVGVAYTVSNEVAYETFTHFFVYNVFIAILPFVILHAKKWKGDVLGLGKVVGKYSYGFYLWHLLDERLFGVGGLVIGLIMGIISEGLYNKLRFAVVRRKSRKDREKIVKLKKP